MTEVCLEQEIVNLLALFKRAMAIYSILDPEFLNSTLIWIKVKLQILIIKTFGVKFFITLVWLPNFMKNSLGVCQLTM